MNVSAAGTGSPDLTPRLVNTLPDLATIPTPHGHPAHDAISASLNHLTSAPILHLLQIVEARIFPEGPHHTESMRAQSSTQIDALYPRAEARDIAEKLVTKAAHTIETASVHSQRIPADLDPRAVITIANQFIATGQLPNYLRAAELGREVLSWYAEASSAQAVSLSRPPSLTKQFHTIVARMWRRAPLLVLLTGWLLAGSIAGLVARIISVPDYKTAPAFEVWAVGFLALIVFQFVATIRGAFRRSISKQHR